MVMCDDRTESIAAFTVNHSSITHAIGGKVMCRHCGRLGHEESVCYLIIGYPSSWVSRGRARGRGRGSRGGQSTGNKSRGGDQEIAYSARLLGCGQNVPVQRGQGTEQQLERRNHTTFGFTSYQIQKLPSLIERSNPGYEKLVGKFVWIIDSKASGHMTGKL